VLSFLPHANMVDVGSPISTFIFGGLNKSSI